MMSSPVSLYPKTEPTNRFVLFFNILKYYYYTLTTFKTNDDVPSLRKEEPKDYTFLKHTLLVIIMFVLFFLFAFYVVGFNPTGYYNHI